MRWTSKGARSDGEFCRGARTDDRDARGVYRGWVWFSYGRVESVEDLITACDSTGEGRTSATLIASVTGVWILLSAPEAGALYGIAAVVGYGVGEAIPMLAYSKLGPRIREVIPEGHSLTEYAYARYGGAM